MLYGYNALPCSLNDAQAGFAPAQYRQTFLGLAPPLRQLGWRSSFSAHGTLNAGLIRIARFALSQWQTGSEARFPRLIAAVALYRTCIVQFVICYTPSPFILYDINGDGVQIYWHFIVRFPLGILPYFTPYVLKRHTQDITASLSRIEHQ